MFAQKYFLMGLAFGITTSSLPTFAFLGEKKNCSMEVGVTGAYFKLAPDDRLYATSNMNVAANNFNSLLKAQPRARLAGGIDVTYGSDVKIHINYLEAKNRRRQSNSGIIGPSLIPPSWNDNNARGVSSHLDSRYCATTVSIRYPFSLSSFTLTPCLGVSYLSLGHNHAVGYQSMNGVPGINALVNLNSKFKGCGPNFGAIVEFSFMEYLSVFANLQYTPYIGTINGKYKANRSVAPVPPAVNYDVINRTRSTVISHTQTDVGIGWSKEMNKCYNLNLKLGYRIIKVTGGRETALLMNAAATSSINHQVSHSALHGPFLRLGMRFKL